MPENSGLQVLERVGILIAIVAIIFTYCSSRSNTKELRSLNNNMTELLKKQMMLGDLNDSISNAVLVLMTSDGSDDLQEMIDEYHRVLKEKKKLGEEISSL